MTLTNFLTIIAILVGPAIAVQLTRHLDDRNAKRDRKLSIYRILMATRATNLSVAHVEALNSIDIEFNGSTSIEKLVRETWRSYLDHLNGTYEIFETWNSKRVELFVELMHKMGQSLGYEFDKVHIKNGVYFPQGHADSERDQQVIRSGLNKVLSGEASFPVEIINKTN